MNDQKADYERQATKYEDTAKRVTDPRMRERFLTLAKHCRETKRVPAHEAAQSVSVKKTV
jgi:hypothetical protein